jgi:segregation and condensation protein A
MSEPTPETTEPREASGPRGYTVTVGEFEGPLDLLLHLVRINEVEITDIPIIEITEQYNRHLDMMRELNLEIAGEYIVMAATLMHIKSRMLLPADPEIEGEEDSTDPRAELAQQLVDYQRFKQAAENLHAMESRRTLVWTRQGVPEEFADEELIAVDLYDLMRAFRKMIGRLDAESRLRLTRDTVSVAEKIQWLTDLLEQQRSLDLLRLFEDLPSNLDRIATFLAVLELVRIQVIVVFQRKLFDEVRIALRAEPAATSTGPPSREDLS